MTDKKNDFKFVPGEILRELEIKRIRRKCKHCGKANTYSVKAHNIEITTEDLNRFVTGIGAGIRAFEIAMYPPKDPHKINLD